MSDRIAVFNHGPDRAGRRAGRGLRAPGDRVRRRLRRRLEHRSSATGGGSRSGRRRSACSTRTSRPARASTTETGRVDEVVYLGTVTRYVVELDGGGRARRSCARTSRLRRRDARDERGAGCGSRGGPSTRSTIDDPRRRETQNEELGQRWPWSPGRVLSRSPALLAPSSSVGGGSGLEAAAASNLPTSIGTGEGQLKLIAWEGYTSPSG